MVGAGHAYECGGNPFKYIPNFTLRIMLYKPIMVYQMGSYHTGTDNCTPRLETINLVERFSLNHTHV